MIRWTSKHGSGVWGGHFGTIPTPAPPPRTVQKGFACTLALDPATGDIPIQPYLARGPDAIIQKIDARLGFFLGEYVLDLLQGVPYFQAVFIKNPSLVVLNSLVRKVLIMTPGILTVASVTTVLDKKERLAATSFQATGEDDLVLTATNQPFIVTGDIRGISYG